MAYIYKNKGTCSVQTEVELNPDHTIKSVKVLGGCDGNLKGIASLLPGMKAEDAIARMEETIDPALMDAYLKAAGYTR